MEDESNVQTREKYLLPKKSPHINIGRDYQAKIPGTMTNPVTTKPHNKKAEKTLSVPNFDNLTKHNSIEEEVEEFKPQVKRRKLDIGK